MDKPIKDWGKGIPRYTEDDLLQGLELYEFCTNVVAHSMQNEGYTIDGVIIDHAPTQVIANKDGKQFYVIVAGGIYPNEGRISFAMKHQFSRFCIQQNVVPMFASVGLMSQDEERAAAGLALKYDGYMIKYTGAQDLTQIKEPKPSDEEYQAYCVENIIEAYSTGHFEILYDFFDDQIQLHSQWVLQPLVGKEALVDYYDGKGKSIRSSGSKLGGSVVMINRNHKRMGKTVLMSEPGKLCALIHQELRGNVNWIFISPKFTSENKLCELSLNDPALFSFAPYYTFD